MKLIFLSIAICWTTSLQPITPIQNISFKSFTPTVSKYQSFYLSSIVTELESALSYGISTANALGSYVVDKALEIYKQLHNSYKQTLTESIKKSYSVPAQVRKTDGIHPLEQAIIKKRMETAQQAIEKLTGEKTPLKIGFIGTGGGYRAMILTAGYFEILNDLGIADTLSYCSSLSGSTWFLAPFIQRDDSIKTYINETLQTKFKQNNTDITKLLIASPEELVDYSSEIIQPKILFDQSISLIEPYGALLGEALFSDMGDARYQLTLAGQAEKLNKGTKPFPIYTAASLFKETEATANPLYHTYEFTPYEITNLNLNLGIPAYAWGWEFKKGFSTQCAPLEKLSTFMGLFGSAFTVNLFDLERQNSIEKAYENKAKKSSTSITEKLNLGVQQATLQKSFEVSNLKKLRIAPLEIKNPFLELPTTLLPSSDTWIKNIDHLTFVDAGIDYNIPLAPLVRPSRELDLIIIGESSGDAAQSIQIDLAIKAAKQLYGYTYTQEKNLSTGMMTIYTDNTNKKAPVIAYFNYIPDSQIKNLINKSPELQAAANAQLYNTFDGTCLKNYCDTFNFNYTLDQYRQLKGAAYMSIKTHKDQLLALIKKIAAQKKSG